MRAKNIARAKNLAKVAKVSKLKVAALQLSTLPLSDSRLDYYLELAKKQGVSIALLGEYVINSFFSELKTMPKSMIKEQSEQKKKALKDFALKYELDIIAPIVNVKNSGVFKAIAHFSPKGVKYKNANALIPYAHWNEAGFFSADTKLDISAFSLGGVRFACMFGFEAHFDEFWRACKDKKIDCVLMPTACALGSNERWDALLGMRAFCGGLYILRANRLGKAKFKDGKCEVETSFYGRSMLIDAHGEIINNLEEKEGMLICELDKNALNSARKLWKFSQIASTLQV